MLVINSTALWKNSLLQLLDNNVLAFNFCIDFIEFIFLYFYHDLCNYIIAFLVIHHLMSYVDVYTEANVMSMLSFPFLRYGHQTADIKPFPKLTSARLFSQEPCKKLFLRRHKASLKIFEEKACKVPIKSSFFAAFTSLVKTLFISTSSLSHGDKA